MVRMRCLFALLLAHAAPLSYSRRLAKHAPQFTRGLPDKRAAPLCGHDFCTAIDPASWCREDNGVCQGNNAPCACSEISTSQPPLDVDQSTTQKQTLPTTSQANEPHYSSTTQKQTLPTTSQDVEPPMTRPPKGSTIEQYKAVAKAIYVWNTGDLKQKWWQWDERHIDLLVSVCKVHNFTRAIVFIGSIEWDWETYFQQHKLPHEQQFVALFAALRKAGVMPTAAFYLNDDPNGMAGWEKAADIVDAVNAFNLAHPGSAVIGIDGDQEPDKITEEYQKMNAHMRIRRDRLGAPLVIAASLKPGWLRHQYGKKLMAGPALNELDEGMIMAYSSKPDLSRRWGDISLSLAAERARGMSIAIEVSPRAPSTDTFWDMASGAGKEAFLQLVVDMDNHYRSGEDKDVYHDFVIHDYEGFFEAMYGVKATDFTFDAVRSVFGS